MQKADASFEFAWPIIIKTTVKNANGDMCKRLLKTIHLPLTVAVSIKLMYYDSHIVLSYIRLAFNIKNKVIKNNVIKNLKHR